MIKSYQQKEEEEEEEEEEEQKANRSLINKTISQTKSVDYKVKKKKCGLYFMGFSFFFLELNQIKSNLIGLVQSV